MPINVDLINYNSNMDSFKMCYVDGLQKLIN